MPKTLLPKPYFHQLVEPNSRDAGQEILIAARYFSEIQSKSSTTATMATVPTTDLAAASAAASASASSAAASLTSMNRSISIHHRLYEFAKTALIKIFVSPYATVCDLYCGSGADMEKWDEAQIGHYIGIDMSDSGIGEVREVWESDLKPYTAEFLEFDPCFENLGSHLQDKGIPADIVCCLQHLQLCFESEERARRLLQNVSAMLSPGGYFFGITPDSSTIWTKYQKIVETSHNRGLKPNAVPNCIRSENYVITFEVEEEKFPLFGKKYQLKFSEDGASETHCLVHFPSLIRLAREAGLEFVEIQNFTEFYEDNRAQFAGMLHGYGPNFVDPRGRLLIRAFDVLGLYATFVFQKPDPDVAPPIFSPMLPDGEYMNEEDGEMSGQADTIIPDHHNNEKGILGPGPADLRFPEPFKGIQYPTHIPDESSW